MEENTDQPTGRDKGHLQTLVLNDGKSRPPITTPMFALTPFNQGKEYLDLKKLKEEQLELQLIFNVSLCSNQSRGISGVQIQLMFHYNTVWLVKH